MDRDYILTSGLPYRSTAAIDAARAERPSDAMIAKLARCETAVRNQFVRSARIGTCIDWTREDLEILFDLNVYHFSTCAQFMRYLSLLNA